MKMSAIPAAGLWTAANNAYFYSPHIKYIVHKICPDWKVAII